MTVLMLHYCAGLQHCLDQEEVERQKHVEMVDLDGDGLIEGEQFKECEQLQNNEYEETPDCDELRNVDYSSCPETLADFLVDPSSITNSIYEKDQSENADAQLRSCVDDEVVELIQQIIME